MDLVIHPRALRGAVTPPPSKSLAHRLILCAALAEGESRIRSLSFSQDILATLRCCVALGAEWERDGENAIRMRGIGGTDWPGGYPLMDCGESASTLRFLIPITLAVAGGGIFTGHGRLMRRPQTPYFDLFEEKNIHYSLTGDYLRIDGKLTGGIYRLPGNVSSQFFTGLLYALAMVEGESRLIPTTRLESSDYVSMTLDALEQSGVHAIAQDDGFSVSGQRFHPLDCEVENDWSQAGFWLAAQGLGSDLELCGMNEASRQGDRCVADFMRALSASGDVELDVTQCPDLVPPLAARAAVRQGRCRIGGAGRLRAKESDRLSTVTAALNAMGARVTEEIDALTVEGVDTLHGRCTIDCAGDHRIAMMAAVAATRCVGGDVRLHGADCVKKSYPDFWEVYRRLGGNCYVVDLG